MTLELGSTVVSDAASGAVTSKSGETRECQFDGPVIRVCANQHELITNLPGRKCICKCIASEIRKYCECIASVLRVYCECVTYIPRLLV